MNSRFEIVETALDRLKILQRLPTGDERGFFERLYCESELAELLAGRHIVQVNRTITARQGSVRGLHFQWPPHAETKFVACVRGEVFDVAIDLRQGSSTFLKWHGEVLSDSNHRTMVIPEGFAHGFQTLSDDCEMLYLHTASYHPESEDGLNALDPALAIAWPLGIGERSARDTALPLLASTFPGVVL